MEDEVQCPQCNQMVRPRKIMIGEDKKIVSKCPACDTIINWN